MNMFYLSMPMKEQFHEVQIPKEPTRFGTVFGIDVAKIELSASLTSEAKAYGESLKKKKIEPEEIAELFWSLRRQLQRDLEGTREQTIKDRTQIVQSNESLGLAVAIYRELLANPELESVLERGLARHEEERERVNGSYEQYQTFLKEYEEKEEKLAKLFSAMFAKRGKEPQPTDLVRRALLEDRLEELEALMRETKQKNPYTAAQIEYDLTCDYASQLRNNGFIWTDSRRAILRRIFTVATTSGRPVFALMGETGVGKTGFAKAAAHELTDRGPERTVGGEGEAFRRLLAFQAIGKDGETYWEYGPLLRAMTGKDSSLDEKSSHDGGIFFDDEYNTRPTSIQREILKFVSEARAGKKVTVPGTPLEITVAPRFLYLAAGNPPSARYKREATGIETKREFSANVVNVTYLEQTPDNPELHRILKAALMNTDTNRLTATSGTE